MSDFWDARYAAAAASDGTVWSLEPNAWVAATVGGLPTGGAVDLGAGEGRNALWLASLGWRVTAVDFSSVGLETGRRRAESLGLDISWVTADATAWVAPQPVDLVVMAYLQLPVEALAAAVARATESLAPGGTFALISHDRDNIAHGVGGPQDPALLTTVDELTAAASGLTIERCEQYERVTAAGTAIDTVLVARRA